MSAPTGPVPGFTDTDLIARVLRDDDRNAFAELVRRHQSALRASLRKMTGNAELADDIAQEAFILAWKKIGSFRFEAKFSTWLYRIAFNAWQSEVRKKQEVLLEGDERPVDCAIPSESEATGLRRDLARAMRVLSDAERAAIHQCYYNDLSHDEAAYVLGVPLGTLKTHILRAKEKLRGVLGDYEHDFKGNAGAAA
ncbi:MAG: sigma-70 family RNA polymerase sigma factor [Betaproteobacteria bacterium]|nr:sigma-70 family RNA polymerase sigma factor [Betaproteobacteria bacterium]